MEVPQGYKQTSIGIIPEDWELNKMVEVADIDKNSLKANTDPDYEFEYISLSDVNDEVFSISKSIQKFASAPSRARRIVQQGDILLSTVRPNLKGFALIQGPVNNLIASTGFAVVTLETAHNSFVYQFLLSDKMQKQFHSLLVGSNYPALNSSDVRNLKIPLPPLPEQQKIAEILSTWDTAIENCQKTIEQLKQRNKGLAQQFLTPEENWQKYKVKDLLKEISRPVSWDDEKFYNLISVRRRSGGVFFRQTLQGKEILTKNLSTVKNGDFLISKMQIVHGASALVCENFENMNVSGSYIVTRCRNEEIMDIRFINYLSKTKRFYHLSYISSYGVHIEKMTFDFKDFQNHSLALPTLAMQREIISILDTASNELKLYEEKLQTLQQQKKGLMQQLLTGKVRTL